MSVLIFNANKFKVCIASTDDIFYICATMDACKHYGLVNLHSRRYQALPILSFNLSFQLKHLLKHLIHLLGQLVIHWRLFSHAVLTVADRSAVGQYWVCTLYGHSSNSSNVHRSQQQCPTA